MQQIIQVEYRDDSRSTHLKADTNEWSGLKCAHIQYKCIVIFANKWFVSSISSLSLKNSPEQTDVNARLHFNVIPNRVSNTKRKKKKTENSLVCR